MIKSHLHLVIHGQMLLDFMLLCQCNVVQRMVGLGMRLWLRGDHHMYISSAALKYVYCVHV